MDFQKPTTKTGTETATLVGGIFAGSLVSRGAYGMFAQTKAVTEAEKKTQVMVNYGIRAGLAVGAGALAASIKSSDTLSVLAKGALYGIAGQQLVDGVSEAAAKSPSVQKLASSTNKISQAAAKSLGLNCACDQPALNGSKWRKHALRAVDTSAYGPSAPRPGVYIDPRNPQPARTVKSFQQMLDEAKVAA